MVTYPKDWIERTLQESCIPYGLVRGPFGGSLKKEMFKPNGNKVYEQRNAIYKSINIGEYYVDDEKYKEMERFSVHENDFIISCSGTIGRIYKIPSKAPKGIINQALLKITLNTDVCDSDYFYKYFEWDKFQSKIVDDTQGGAMKNLVGMDKFRNTKIFMPQDINEQKNIATTLSTFDTHIDNLTALIEKKKAIRDGALANLMSGRTRLEGFSGEWEEKTLEEIAILMVDGPFGSDLKTEHYTSNHEARIIQLGNIGDDGWNDENVKYTTFSHAEDLNRCIAHPGDVLIAKMMPAGRSILCPNKEKMYIIASDVVRVELGDNVDSRFIIYSTKGMYYLNQIAENTQGSTRQRTSISKLKKIKLMLPQYDEQKAIADALSAMDAEIDSLKTERDKFEQIREGAMDDLLTGRVRLPM